MVFQNDGLYFAIVHTPVIKPPVSFTLQKDVLLQLRHALTAADAEPAFSPAGAPAPEWQNQCARIFDLAFPRSVASLLREAAPDTPLCLHLTPDLLDIPWEYAFDGEQFLAIKFKLTRQLITEQETRHAPAAQPRTARLQVLIIIDRAFHDVIAAGLHAGQEAQIDAGDFDLTIQPVDALDGNDLQRLARRYSVIHFMGSVTPGAQGWSWSCGVQAQQAQSLDTNRALETIDTGLVVITEMRPTGAEQSALPNISAVMPGWASSHTPHVISNAVIADPCRIAFALQLYGCLARGESIGHALNHTQRSLARHWALGWAGYQLYGNSDLTLRVLPSKVELPSENVEEYRQLTVMFCDLVNSTGIAQKLGLESWQRVLQCYQRACTTVIERHGGHVHEYKGDGLVVYFGFPVAFEDSARRAARAGLEMARDFSTYFAGVRDRLADVGVNGIAMRVGIHTGRVVIGEVGGRATAAGLTLAYTERLQQAAPPGGVVVSERTHRLIERHFRLDSMGTQMLKGIVSVQTCYLVEEETDRSESPKVYTPLCGREAEIAELESRWHGLKPGVAQIVHIAGEAGMGKSRLVKELRTRIRQSNAMIFECRCSQYLQNSALYPLIQGLRHNLRVDRMAGHDAVLAAIEANVPHALREQIVPAVAYLLDLPCEPRYRTLAGSLEKKRLYLCNALVQWLMSVATQRSILLIVEDAHWSDPSTLEFLKRFSERLNAGHILILITSRTEGAPWICPIAAEPMNLGRVSATAVRAMVHYSCGEQTLPANVVDLIVERTDGVPLFVEESAKMAVESVNAASPEHADEHGEPMDIPPTIHDLLTTQLDRLGRAKETAQLAATVGRKFSESTLLSATDTATATLTAHLSILVDSGMMLRREAHGEKIYSFKHFLLREAAYTSMLSPKRRSLHGRIAAVLANTGAKTDAPELLAHHYTEAGDMPRAIDYWMTAGSQAKQRSGHAEAINHYRRALALIEKCPRTEAMAQTELSAQKSLSNCIAAVSGYNPDEAGAA